VGFVNIGPLEILVVLIIALIVLGPQRLPDAAKAVGKGMREFRDSLSEATGDEKHDDEDEPEAEARGV
jgi:sec-independent protein translocase protein TatA